MRSNTVKAIAWVIIAIVVVLYAWQQQKGKVDPEVLAAQIAAKIKVEKVNADLAKKNKEQMDAITDLKKKETVIDSELSITKKELMKQDQFNDLLSSQLDNQEEISNQFSLALKANKELEDLSLNLREQIDRQETIIQEYVVSVQVITDEFNKTDALYQEELKKSHSHTIAVTIGGQYNLNGTVTFGVNIGWIALEY
jgi:hypothetical protein